MRLKINRIMRKFQNILNPYMKSVLTVISFCFVLTSFCQVTTWKQVRKEKKKRFEVMKELKEANGEISVETYFPVDTSFYNFTKVYLDSYFKKLNDEPYETEYYIYQNEIDGWNYGLLPKKKPFRVKIESIVYDTLVPGFFKKKDAIVYKRIEKGELIYRSKRFEVHYYVRNAKIVEVISYDIKNNRKDSQVDYSTLYRNNNLCWPIYSNYDRKGEVKKKTIIFYYDGYDYGGTSLVEWKF